MVRLNKFNSKTTKIDHSQPCFVSFNRGSLSQIYKQTVAADQRKIQFGGVDRCIYFLQYIWKRTNMILMTMVITKSFHLGNILFQVGNI